MYTVVWNANLRVCVAGRDFPSKLYGSIMYRPFRQVNKAPERVCHKMTLVQREGGILRLPRLIFYYSTVSKSFFLAQNLISGTESVSCGCTRAPTRCFCPDASGGYSTTNL